MERVAVLVSVFNLYTKVILMPAPFPSEICRMLKEACLATHSYRRIEVERQFVDVSRSRPSDFSLDERIELGPVTCFGETVEKKSGMVWIG